MANKIKNSLSVFPVLLAAALWFAPAMASADNEEEPTGGATEVPELSAEGAGLGAALVIGGALILADRRRRHAS